MYIALQMMVRETMSTIDRVLLLDFVKAEIVKFHEARLASLGRINLQVVLKRKNHYLFRAKNLTVASDLVAAVLSAYLSSSEEGLFGKLLEELAIFVSEQACGGRKSSAPGLDLEFDRDGVRYLVAVKSGPNWGNNSQWARLADNFRRAVIAQRQSDRVSHVQPVVGMCYGKEPAFKDAGNYWKMTGQTFWHFLSGDEDLYLDIIEPIGHEAKKHNDAFELSRAAIENRLTSQFIRDFCNDDFSIAWDRLVAFNSGNITKSLRGVQ